jgi:hypothetical protein
VNEQNKDILNNLIELNKFLSNVCIIRVELARRIPRYMVNIKMINY